MKRRSFLALGGASLALAVAPAVAFAAKVSVRIEGATRTLQAVRTVSTPSGSITKFGAPSGACPAASALGALNTATHGRWKGKFYASYNDYLIGSITKFGAPSGACPAASALGALNTATHGRWKGKFYASYNDYLIGSILGETPSPQKGYWGLWVNNKYATTGACEVKLTAGENVLFAVDSVKKHEHPLGIIAPRNAKAGTPFTVKVVSYSDRGKATPLAGAHVRGGGLNLVTGKHGTAPVADGAPTALTFTAADSGFIRSAPATVKVTR
jgi:hypothetical protein